MIELKMNQICLVSGAALNSPSECKSDIEAASGAGGSIGALAGGCIGFLAGGAGALFGSYLGGVVGAAVGGAIGAYESIFCGTKKVE